MGKRIIFLTSYWDSRVDPTVVCTRAMVNQFVTNHYDVIVSTYWGRRKERYKSVDGYKVCYVRPPLTLTIFDAYYHSKNKVLKKFYYVIAKITNTLHRLFTIANYPIDSARFVKRWAKATDSLINMPEETILVSVVNPENTIYVGEEVKKRNPKIKWILHYLDCGSNVLPGSTFERFRRILQSKSVSAENRALSLSDKIIVMRGHYEYYFSHLSPLNVQKLLMADIPLLHDSPQVSASGNCFKFKDNLKVVYAGAMTGVYYDPKSICDYFAALKKYIPNATMDLYGITDKDTYLNEISNTGVGIKYHGAVQHDLLKKIFSEADILIYYKNERIDSVSGKFFEYLSYLKPVIYYGIKRDINYNNVLRYDYGLSLDCKEDLDENAKNTVSFLKSLEEKPPIDYENIKEVFEMSLPSYAYSLIVS